ncbi:GGDEF domain-containing protein [Paenibacillus sp. LHD-38]|uniref:GGDEF domain-containing protein n=1 Tax=Paenibacillus sp. LHD-38 TaxID=3072143 RepID=UPI00280C5C0D|nr:GGDEF domain-containing protein [Paenibacillus sp. LHD-38]MDQ8734332.1 GGDEF domain-containing protein [Paenibacillus sp. LHD-38]
MFIALLLAEGLIRYMKQYFDYVLITMGYAFALVIMFAFGEDINGLYMSLDIPIIVSLFYFSKKRLWFSMLLTLESYFVLLCFIDSLKDQVNLYDLITVTGMISGSGVIGFAILKRGNELQQSLERAVSSEMDAFVDSIATQNASKYDHLTNLYNHITYQEYLTALTRQHDAYAMPLQLAALDIDNFKSINDRFGHHVGDIVLQETALLLKSSISSEDVAARYGGEEFVLLLTGKTIKQSHELLERIRERLAMTVFPELDHESVTISIGMAEYTTELGKETLFKLADGYLYEAKRAGKNQVVSPIRRRDESAAEITQCS